MSGFLCAVITTIELEIFRGVKWKRKDSPIKRKSKNKILSAQKMKIVSRRKVLKDKLISGVKRYLTINLVFFLLLVLIRIYELFYLKHTITLPSGLSLIHI